MRRASVCSRSLIGPCERPDQTGPSSGRGLCLSWLRLLSLRNPRGRLTHAFVDLVSELPEILDEQIDQPRGHGVIFGRIGPGAAGVEDRRVHAWNGNRHFEAEVGVLAE